MLAVKWGATALVFGLLAHPVPGWSQNDDALEAFFQGCRIYLWLEPNAERTFDNGVAMGICVGTISALMGSMALNCGSKGQGFNPPIETTTADVPRGVEDGIRASLDYYEQHRAELGMLNPWSISMIALASSFPCED